MELKREQIVKALECCSENEDCSHCPCWENCKCINSLLRDALALIRELTEECKKWQSRLEIECDYTKADTVRKMQEELVSEPLPIFVYEGERLVTCKRINDVADKLLREVE